MGRNYFLKGDVMIMDKFGQAFMVAEGIKKTTSDEMRAYLEKKDLNVYQIRNLALQHVKDSCELEKFLIERFPKQVKDL